MTEERRQARIAMLRQRKTFDDLAAETGLSLATIHAALSNTCTTVKARQAITNALQTELWPAVRVTQRFCSLPAGTEFEFPKTKQADDSSKQLKHQLPPDCVTRRGRVLIFNKPVVMAIDIGKAKHSAKARNRKTL